MLRNFKIHLRITKFERPSNSLQATCTDSTLCGKMPLYQQLGKQIPVRPEPGLFPWQVNIYANGNYVCGGTLMHKFWVLTHQDCARQFDLERDYVVARAGQHREHRHFDAYNQIRAIVHRYRVGHLLADLGWVDLDLGSSLAGGLLLWLPTAQAGRWNIPNLSQPNLGPRADAPPSIWIMTL